MLNEVPGGSRLGAAIALTVLHVGSIQLPQLAFSECKSSTEVEVIDNTINQYS